MRATRGRILLTDCTLQAHAYTVDISDRQQVYATAKRVREDLGPVDILVRDANIFSLMPCLH